MGGSGGEALAFFLWTSFLHALSLDIADTKLGIYWISNDVLKWLSISLDRDDLKIEKLFDIWLRGPCGLKLTVGTKDKRQTTMQALR